MSHKLQFVEKASAMGANISALCREYGISRQTGHKWLRRFHGQGYTGLVEQSRRPLSSPLTTGEEIVVRILELSRTTPRQFEKSSSSSGPASASRSTWWTCWRQR